MIEQQYYTRERGGLFSQTDGYDTVAKSPQLKLEYIKKNLHPICNYEIPSELQKIGEQDEKKYPPNMVILPGSSGELIVGQAVYKSKDFTGLRSTFFMHNFILSENEKRRYMKEPEKLFGITGFKNSFNLEEGRQLPTLAAIPYDINQPYFIDRECLFAKLGLCKEDFHKLIYATFLAAHSKKKVFIILDAALEELGELAKALLYHLYFALPWSISEALGVSTYASKMEAKKNIQITFLDKEALRYETKQSKDFIFDLINHKILNVEGDIEGELYISIAPNYIKNKVAWEKINYWADALSSTLKEADDKDIAYYGRICCLFEMSLYFKVGKRYDLSQPKVRKGLLTHLIKYLSSDIPDDIRRELFDVMEYSIILLEQEIGRGSLFDKEEIHALLKFKLDYCKNREQQTRCIQILLKLLTVASYERQESYTNEILILVHPYREAYLSLFEGICASEELKKQMLFPLLNASFKNVVSLEQLIHAMAGFEEVERMFLNERYYTQLVYEKFGGCLRNIKDFMSFLLQLQNWCRQHHHELYRNLLEQGEYYFLEQICLKDISSEESLCKLSFSKTYNLENYEVIKMYQALKTDVSTMSPNKIRVNSKVQELIKGFYRQKMQERDFYMLIYAFLEMEETSHRLKLNLKRVLSYLYGLNVSLALDFIIWSKDQGLYLDKNKYDGQVISFFVTMKQKGGRIPKEAIKERLGGQAKTKALSEKILYAIKPSFIKWAQKHRISLISMTLLTIIVAASGIWLANYQNHQKEQEKPVAKEVKLDPETAAKLMPDYTTDPEEIKAFLEKRLGPLPKKPSNIFEANPDSQNNGKVGN